MSAVRPEPAVLEGRFIHLEPMTPGHYSGLWEALGHPAVFSGGYGGGPEGLPPDEPSFREWVARYYAGDTRNNHVVRIVGGPHDGAIAGASTLGDFDVAKRGTHIGWTGYDPRLQVLTSGLRSYEIQRRIDGGDWATSLAATTARAWYFNLTTGHLYEFRISARDRAGNVGDWMTRVIDLR